MDATRMINAAATALFIYDTFLTLPDEVELVWPKKWNVIKTCMYLNRLLSWFYLCLLAVQEVPLKTHFSDKFCEVQMIGSGVGAFIAFALCNWMLLGRTKALLGNRPLYTRLLTAFFFVSYGVTAVFVVMTVENLSHGQLFYSKTLHLCAILRRPHVMGFIWICPMLFETTIFLIATVRLYQRAANMHGMSSKLILVLYRDGVSYYFIIIVLRVWNLLAWKVLPISFIFTGLFLLWAIMSIAVTRLQLNLIRALGPQNTQIPVTSQSKRSASTYNSKGQPPVRPNFFHRVIRPGDTFGDTFGSSFEDQSIAKTVILENELPQLEIGNENGNAMEKTTMDKDGLASKSVAFSLEIPMQSIGKILADEEKLELGTRGTTSQGSRVDDSEAKLSGREIPQVAMKENDDGDEHLFGRTAASEMESGTLSARMDR
ncbi:hypothetical protein FRC19_001671 [Serendipita sp. 401]|nr:hypothetical protein FRC19_001671 [Serendipita sp. 401]